MTDFIFPSVVEPKDGKVTVTILKARGYGIDCHRAKAAELFKVAYEDVTPEQRAAGKNANYVDWWKS